MNRWLQILIAITCLVVIAYAGASAIRWHEQAQAERRMQISEMQWAERQSECRAAGKRLAEDDRAPELNAGDLRRLRAEVSSCKDDGFLP